MNDQLYNARGVVNTKSIDWKQYIPLVRHEALKLSVRLPATVELDDLLQVGYMGLLSAIERYDIKLGTEFTTFAMQRIKGAMLDELRSRDWLPRQVRQDIKRVTKAINELEQKLGRSPQENEIANYLDLSLEEYWKILLDSNSSQIYSHDEMQELLGNGIDAIIVQDKDNNPFLELLNSEFRDSIALEIDNLPEKEKLVLALYYQEDLNLKEIGKVLGVSESRVSQLHSQAIKRIKSKLSK